MDDNETKWINSKKNNVKEDDIVSLFIDKTGIPNKDILKMFENIHIPDTSDKSGKSNGNCSKPIIEGWSIFDDDYYDNPKKILGGLSEIGSISKILSQILEYILYPFNHLDKMILDSIKNVLIVYMTFKCKSKFENEIDTNKNPELTKSGETSKSVETTIDADEISNEFLFEGFNVKDNTEINNYMEDFAEDMLIILPIIQRRL